MKKGRRKSGREGGKKGGIKEESAGMGEGG